MQKIKRIMMKEKDIYWYNDKLKSIKKKKKYVNDIDDVKLRKKLKKDLKREHRSVKRAERNYSKKLIKEEIDKL